MIGKCSIAFDFDFFFDSPKNEVFSIFAQMSVGDDNEPFIIRELGINRVDLFE